jgi:hypothetical protein
MARKSILQRDLFSPGKRITRIRASETQDQIALIAWFDWTFRMYRGRLLHIPNGGHRHISTAKTLKSMGVRSGVLDLLLPIPKGEFHGLFIEMKAGTGKPSSDQLDWGKFLDSQNYCVVICTGQIPAKATIKWYLGL